MELYPQKKSWLQKVLRLFFHSAQEKKHALALLNLTQFLGVINDNVFKFVMAFLLIHALGKEEASSILAATGAIYVIPFLLFSSSAGILADRFSKQKLLVILKGVEIVIMGCAIFAFHTHQIFACYTLLFLLAAHSAMFGPSKYGIIPELVPSEKVSKANSLVTSFTYLAIIIGTFLASFLTEITDRQFTWIAVFCLLVACGGFISASLIHHTPAGGSKKVPNFLFISEIYRTLKNSKQQPHLLPSIFGSAFFLFLGAFTQLNIIPFAIEALGFSEVAGGYLFLTTALGIALGSFLAGKLSRKKLDLGIPCFAGFGIILAFWILSLFPHSLVAVISALISIGVLGGIFIIPFDSFIQLYSEKSKRGQTIAAANFLSFAGVLVASISLYVFNRVFDLSPIGSFGLIAGITLLVNILFTLRLSSFSLPLLTRMLYSFKEVSLPVDKGIPFVLEKASLKKMLIVLACAPHLHFLIPAKPKSFKEKFLKLFFSFSPISSFLSLNDCLKKLESQKKGCLCLNEGYPKQKKESSPLTFFKNSKAVILLHVEKTDGMWNVTYENSNSS